MCDLREQYRISGRLTIVDATHADDAMRAARQHAWNVLSDSARSQFAWPHPGMPRDLSDSQAFNQPAPGPKEEPLEPFCLVVLDPHEVCAVDLSTDCHSACSGRQKVASMFHCLVHLCVDHLSLRGQTRLAYTLDQHTGEWSQGMPVNP